MAEEEKKEISEEIKAKTIVKLRELSVYAKVIENTIDFFYQKKPGAELEFGDDTHILNHTERGNKTGLEKLRSHIKISMDTPDQCIALLESIKKGEVMGSKDKKKFTNAFKSYRKTFKEIVADNFNLVARIVKNNFFEGESKKNDMISYGSLALMEAVKNYKFEEGKNTFPSFAASSIKGQIKKYIKEEGNLIKVPLSTSKYFKQVEEAKNTLLEKGNLYPTDEELAEETNISPETISTVRQAMSLTPFYLDGTLEKEGGDSGHDIIPDKYVIAPDVTFKEKINRNLIERQIKRAFPTGKNETRDIFLIKHLFELDGVPKKPWKELYSAAGITKQRLGKIRENFLDRLKQIIEEDEKINIPGEEKKGLKVRIRRGI